MVEKENIYFVKEDVELVNQYQTCFEDFLKINHLHLQNNLYIPLINPRYNLDFEEQKNRSITFETPDLLNDRLSLDNIFSHAGFEPIKPLPIVNFGGNTLFISAGVQIIDNIIHQEGSLISNPKFVAQPVLRTQYIDGVSEGSSTSFINISTEAVNINPQEHFGFIQKWLKIFSNLGMETSKFTFSHRYIDNKTWGDKSFNSFELFVYYDGLEIGDASFNYKVPQSTREKINFSDIGFGLERIKWILQGCSYFDNFTSKYKNEISLPSLAFANTLALLAGSGLKPSNKECGYRFRLFSKRFIDEVKGQHTNLDDLFRENYKYWLKWTDLQTSESEVIETIKNENSRNFNRLLLDQLKDTYPDVGLDINLPTNVLIKRLSGTSVPQDVLNKVIINLHYKNE